jgi:hypothetical protein
MYSSRATLSIVSASWVDVRLASDDDCRVGFYVIAREAMWPNWPWLFEGAEVDVELWDTGDDRFGGDVLWLILRDPSTSEQLMTIYQLHDTLINNGTVGEQLGLGVAIEGPVCEIYVPDLGILEYEYDLHFTSTDTTLALSYHKAGTLPGHAGRPAFHVETGPIRFAFTHLLRGPLSDHIPGWTVYFTAWAEP